MKLLKYFLRACLSWASAVFLVMYSVIVISICVKLVCIISCFLFLRVVLTTVLLYLIPVVVIRYTCVIIFNLNLCCVVCPFLVLCVCLFPIIMIWLMSVFRLCVDLLTASVFSVTASSLYNSDEFNLLPFTDILYGGASSLLKWSMSWVSFFMSYYVFPLDLAVLYCTESSTSLPSTQLPTCLLLLSCCLSMASVIIFHLHHS